MGRISRFPLSIAGLVAILALGGCESDDSLSAVRSPIAPTGAAVTSSATIQGTITSAAQAISSGSSSSPLRSTARTAGMTVSIVGANRSTVADSRGRFTLGGVRPGPVRLRFSGATINDFLDLGSLASGQTVVIIVTVVGSRVVLQSDGVSSRFAPRGNGDSNDDDDNGDDDDDGSGDDSDDQESDDAEDNN